MSRVAAEVPVLYVESLGLRHPRVTRRDAGRIFRRLRAGARGGISLTVDGLKVASPIVLPYHGSKVVRAINRRLLGRQLRSRIELMPEPRLLWTYSPAVVDEFDLSQFAAILYHAVDDLATVPGIPVAIASLERELAPRADAVVASASSLVAKLSQHNSNTHLVGNAADIDHFRRALAASSEPADVAGLPHPRAIFVGALTDYKIDWELFAAVARRLPSWSFVVIGPTGDEAEMTGWRRLAELSNCHLLGQRRYEQLPDYLAAADIGLIPYRLTEHTAGITPLKLVEYIAAGLSVVATPLEPLREHEGFPLTLARDPDTFVAAVEAADRVREHRRRRSESVSSRSWDGLLDRIFAVLPERVVSP